MIAIDELMLEAFAPLATKNVVEKSKMIHVFEEGRPTKSDNYKILEMIWKLLQLVLCMAPWRHSRPVA